MTLAPNKDSLVSANTARKWHKWLMAIVGIQFFIWSFTGLYMVLFNIHFIHGESIVNPAHSTLNSTTINHEFSTIYQQYPEVKNLTLITVLNKTVYRFSSAGKLVAVDAATGVELNKLSKTRAIAIAKQHLAAPLMVKSAKLLNKQAPSELSARHLPVWRIEFDSFASPTLYISHTTGELVTKRHHYWRIFDWFWRFHIMDYDDGENVANWFLLLIALIAVLAAISGTILSYHRLIKSSDDDEVMS